MKKNTPLVINIQKQIKKQNNNIIISGFCLTKLLKNKEFDLSKLKVLIGNNQYKINFKLKKGLPFIKNYKINFYKLEIPINDILTFDIQNKIILEYNKTNKGRIIYSVFDFFKGKNKNSKIISINNTSIYLRQTIKNTMYLTIRESTIYDTFKGKIKLNIGYLLSKLIVKNNIILLFEKNTSKYEESASILYEKLIDLNYKNCYFILNQDNIKLNTIKEKYKKNIIYKNSLKHIIYFFKCRKFLSTEALAHALQLRIANKKAINKLQDKKIMYVFLQHGVMYMVSLNSDLRTGFKKQNYKLHKIVVSSNKEAKHFTDLGDFKLEDLYICGLPKFDKAYKKQNADKIVIMPTWRRWEVNQATKDFTQTKYFKMIKRIIETIPNNLKEKIIVLPHPLMISAIKQNKEYKKYLPAENFIYDDILKNCKLLITDYSSISYDAFYRGSNVIFYWEEKEECLEHYGNNSKLMLNEKNSFGDICYNQKELKKVIENNYNNNQTKEYQNKYQKIVEFHDNKNTERLIKMLKKDNVL